MERPDRGSLAAFRPGGAWLRGGFGWTVPAADGDGLSVAATCTIAETARRSTLPGWHAAALVQPCSAPSGVERGRGG